MQFAIEQDGAGAITALKLVEQGQEQNAVTAQLEEYFAGTRTEFDVALAPKGTEFQQQVWAELLKIPYGKTRTYGQLAASIGRPKAARAVGMALNRNPIPVLIPCHRVIGSNGSLTGFALGLGIKQLMLDIERGNIHANKVA